MGGQVIRKIRETAGLSQEALAFQTGLHRTYISMVERDVHALTLPSLFRICKAVGARPSKVVAKIEKLGLDTTPSASSRLRKKKSDRK